MRFVGVLVMASVAAGCGGGAQPAAGDVYVVAAVCGGACPWLPEAGSTSDVYTTTDPDAARGRYVFDADAWGAYEPDRDRAGSLRSLARRVADNWTPGTSSEIDTVRTDGLALRLGLYTAERDGAQISPQ